MQDLDDFLSYVVSNVDGALFAALGSVDGLLVDQYPKQGNDLSAFTAELTNVLGNVGRLNQAGFDGGPLQEAMVTAERLMSYARMLNDELFLFIVMNPSGNLGKARLYSEQVAPQILEMFT